MKVWNPSQFRYMVLSWGFYLQVLQLASQLRAIILFRKKYIKGETNLKKLNTYYHNVGQWEARVSNIRERILSGAELNPLPKRTPLNPIIHSIRNHTDYSVANYYFESLPGFFVAGNIYRPIESTADAPKAIILLPQGHFSENRFADFQQELGTTFARMGAIAITYDMIGRGESTQLNHNDKYVLGLQLWNSIRVIDFALTLDEADPTRIGVTGASGEELKPSY